MAKIKLQISLDYSSKIEKPWARGNSPLDTPDIRLGDLKTYLQEGNPDVKGIRVERKGESLIIKYKGKKIDLGPLKKYTS